MNGDFLRGFVFGVLVSFVLAYFVVWFIDARLRDAAKRQQERELQETISDGWNVYPCWCDRCGAEIQIIRPGDARCPNGCFERHGDT